MGQPHLSGRRAHRATRVHADGHQAPYVHAHLHTRDVAYGYDHPLRKNWGDAFGIEGRPAPAPGQAMGASFRPVTPGYFEAVGIPLQQGRTFEPTDAGDRPFVVVINEALASRYFAGEEPVGRRIRIPTVERIVGAEPGLWMEIVGVVANVRFNGPTEAIEPAMYVSIPQVPPPENEERAPS